jgi:hypothetical protein
MIGRVSTLATDWNLVAGEKRMSNRRDADDHRSL